MRDLLRLALAWAAGAALGAFFFGGLWWTIRRGIASPQPALWFVVSLPLRMGVTLGGFYLVSRGHWQPLVPCLVGFTIARAAMRWLIPSPGTEGSRATRP
jgi:F1F0 ATPase subunit 2